MPKADLDDQIDQLYKLPLDEFTAARNALAKDAGDRAGEVKKLEKPNLAAWTVNQLYWRERDAYEAVIKAAEKMRAAYKQMLAGKSADVRAAEDVHQDALREAKQAARRILDEGGHPNPDAVMMPVAETLDALPGEEPPGRLTKPLRRMGFNVLEGLPISAKAGPVRPAAKPKEPVKETSARERRANEAEEREVAMARERLRFAEAAEREAESSLDRAKRALERLQRIRERAEKEFEDAVKAEKTAEKEVTAAEKSLEKAAADRERLAKKISA
jgi:predicted RNase H-like nuclease (RuvC/YqgF family)